MQYIMYVFYRKVIERIKLEMEKQQKRQNYSNK